MRIISNTGESSNVTFMFAGENCHMEQEPRAIGHLACEHSWNYYIEVGSRRLHSRRCAGCGCEERMAARHHRPAAADRPVRPVRLSA
jgi:hypothetical protein